MRNETTLIQHSTRKRVFAIISSASGNLVEWYDFYVYSFASIYFAPQFFLQMAMLLPNFYELQQFSLLVF